MSEKHLTNTPDIYEKEIRKLQAELDKANEALKVLKDAVESDIECLDIFAGKPVWYGFKIAFRDASGMQRDKARESLKKVDEILGVKK